MANWPVHRLLLSRGGNLYTRWALRLPLTTPPAATGPTAAELIDRLPFDDVASQGYCFQVDRAWRAVRAGSRVAEVPITFTERAVRQEQDERLDRPGGIGRVTVWGLQDRLADWLPGRVPRPCRPTATAAASAAR